MWEIKGMHFSLIFFPTHHSALGLTHYGERWYIYKEKALLNTFVSPFRYPFSPSALTYYGLLV